MVRVFVVLSAMFLAGVAIVEPSAVDVPEEFQPNYDKGYSVGYPKGYKVGFTEGKDRGRTEGRENGTNDGKNDGWEAAFQPAYDIAYDARFPVGHFAGWKDGLDEGFDEGFDYAPVIAKQVYEYYGINMSSGAIVSTSGFGWSGNYGGEFGLDISSGFFGATYTVWRDDLVPVDYAKVYYDEGYDDGHAFGYSTGSQEGYDLIYPKAYAAAYAPAYRLGVSDGTREGTKQGRTDGYDEGFDAGYNSAYDEGFYAGIDYRLFGEFSISKYSLDYTRRSDRFTRQALLAAQAPEPGSVVLALFGAVALVGNARRRPSLRDGARRG